MARAAVGALSAVSEAHFARSFKQAFGVPPHRYLLTRRLEHATALLRDSDLSVTEIAFQTGWESLGTFGRTFRDVTGESPSELRARERAAANGLDRSRCASLRAAHRPDLTIAVSEKRRRDAALQTSLRTSGGRMSQGVGVVGVYVRDQDEALAFYVEKLGFRVHTDVRVANYRWLTVQHPDQPSFQLGLFTPESPMLDAATAQTLRAIVAKGAMPPLVLSVTDCRAAHDRMLARGVEFTQEPDRPLRHRGRGLPRPVGQRVEAHPGAPLGAARLNAPQCICFFRFEISSCACITADCNCESTALPARSQACWRGRQPARAGRCTRELAFVA